MGVWQPELYADSTSWQQTLNKNFISTYQFLGEEYILDIGCGTGELAFHIANLVPRGHVVGIDSSESMIEFAKKKFFLNNLTFIKINALDISFTEKFDLITSTFCLHWIANKLKMFIQAFAHLKKNGRIYFLMPLENEILARVRKQLMTKPFWLPFFKDKDDPQDTVLDSNYPNYASQAGFTRIQYDIENKDICYENVTVLFRILYNITACLSHIPNEDLKKRFVNEYISEYLKIHPAEEDGSCYVSCTYGKLIATKD